MAKPLIYAIVGASGCGKTTATKIMEEYGIPSLVSYTTRDIRDGETNGKEHWFVTDNEIPDKSRMLAYTFFGGKHYWTTIDQITGDNGCSYVIDEIALLEMIEKFGKEIDIVTILIKKDKGEIEKLVDAERMKRDKERLTLNDDFYDIVISNDSSIDDLRKQILLKVIHRH
ncbi:MAG: guanylate kinase [Muribaculaceae bacterium]